MSGRSPHRPRPLRLGWTLCLATALSVSCGEPPAEEVSLDRLRPVELPGLDAFSPSVREQLGSRYSRLRELAEAGGDPAELGEAYGTMGMLLMAYEMNRAAEPALLNATALLPKDFRWHYYLAHLYNREGEAEQATAYLERTVDLRPDYTPAVIGLATMYWNLGRDSAAQAILEEVLGDDPENASAHFLMGELLSAHDPSRAAAHFETVLRLQPDASVARYPLAQAYQELGRLERSREHMAQRGDQKVALRDSLFELLSDVRRGPGALIARGNDLASEGRLREAVDLYEAALDEDSTSVSALIGLGIAAARLQELHRASEALERALRLDPTNVSAHHALGLVALVSGDPDREAEALEHFRAALDADPRATEVRQALADFLWRNGRCEAAVRHYEEILVVKPADLSPIIRIAVCQAHLGDYARAREVLESGLEASPDAPQLLQALVRVLAASRDASVRDGERALEIAERLTESYRYPETLEGLAMAWAELERFDQAIQYQKEAIREAERRDASTSRLDYMRGVLHQYEQGEPSRQPWRPGVFGG